MENECLYSEQVSSIEYETNKYGVTYNIGHELLICDIMSIATSALAQDVIMRMPNIEPTGDMI